MIGQIISHYKIIEKLGEGGMGVVYRAEDTKLKRTVALKFLPKGLEAHEPERARFLQEAQAASALNHTSICTIYDLQEYEGPASAEATAGKQQFIVMEYVDGKTLRQMVPIQKIQDAITFAIQIGDALHEAHGHGIVHRDVKPENIMVNTKNQIKVMDFGLAKLKGSMKLTRTSSTVGTLAYMAPEQIQGGEVDARSDIFSFGIVLYEMLTGHLPFCGEHEAAMMYSIVNEEPAPLQKFLPDVSPELIHIVITALEKDPNDRYQSAADVVRDLRRVQKQTSRVQRPAIPGAGSGVELPPSQVRGAESPPSGKKMHTKSLWWWGLAGVLLLIAAIIFFVVLPSHPPRLNPNMSFRTLEIPFTQIYYPGLSRDGSWIAFGACDAKNEWSVYFMNVAQGNPRRLTTEPLRETYNADISPDMSEILYDGCPPGRMRGIYVISSAGGVGRKVTEPGTLCKWRPDGQLIGYCRLGRSGVPSQSGKFEFWTVKRDGTENRLEFVDSLSYIFAGLSFDWSPDGNSIAWLRSFPAYNEIFIHDLKSGKERQLTSYKKGIDEVIWALNDQICFTSNKSGNTNVWMIPASGGEAVQITKGTGPDLGVRISADGKRLLYMEQRTISHLWTADIDGGNARQLTFENQFLEAPSFSADKKRISFNVWSTDILRPGSQVFIMQSDGTNRTQLTAGDAQYYFAEWSPDGKYMAYASSRIDERFDSCRIYLTEVENPGTPRLVGKGIGVRWINAEKFVTVIAPLLPHAHTTLYSVHSSEPIEASEDSTNQFPLPDGKYIAVRDFRKGREGWWLKTVGMGQGAPPKQILSSEYMSASFPSVSLRYIMYRQANGEVWRISLPDAKRERLPDILNGINPQGNIQMSFDDKQLVFLKERIDARLVLIENLFE